MPKSKKFDTLSQEVFQRLHNTKDEIEWETKVEMLEKFMSELKASGYNESDRYEILKSGINRYKSLRKKEEEGLRPFFRSKFFRRKERDEEKSQRKVNWFRKHDNKFTLLLYATPKTMINGTTLLFKNTIWCLLTFQGSL